MKTKLTLKLDKDIIQLAKDYANSHDTSLSKIVELALSSNFKDFEDAIQYYTTVKNKVDYLITRNIKEYKYADIPVFTADEFLVMCKAKKH